MKRSFALAALGAALLLPQIALGDTPAATSAPLTATESAFVTRVTTDLQARFPTAARAEAAGFVRYTNEDETGAISYANQHWNSSGPSDPSQLWYDVHGRLIGADYSVFLDEKSPQAPSLFGLGPSRAHRFGAHVHYVLKQADGYHYDLAIGAKKYADATGLDPMHPTAAGLVKAGRAKSEADVATVFLFPAIWDVAVWLVPNPAGPFANANPNVKPSKPAKMDSM
jgi:hypothetical protein